LSSLGAELSSLSDPDVDPPEVRPPLDDAPPLFRRSTTTPATFMERAIDAVM